MDRYSGQQLITQDLVVAFTTYNPGADFSSHVSVAALECKQVLIIDDASVNGFGDTQDASWPPNVVVMLKSHNQGIADSVNRALDYANAAGIRFLMLFDQDTVVTTGLITDAVCSASQYQSLSNKPFGCMGAGVIHGRKNVGSNALKVSEVPEVIQSGTVFSVAALEAIGGANADLFIDGVDTDICLRLRERGYSVVTDRCISISHPVGSGKAVAILGHSVLVTNHSPMRRYYMTRNRVYILRQFRWWRLDLMWCLVYLRRFFVSSFIAAIFEEQRYLKCRAMVSGLSDGLRGRLGLRSR